MTRTSNQSIYLVEIPIVHRESCISFYRYSCESKRCHHIICVSVSVLEIVLVFAFQKNDKWQKMMSQEESSVMLMEFLDKGDSLILVIYVNQQGQFTPINDFPATSKNKVGKERKMHTLYFMCTQYCTVISHVQCCTYTHEHVHFRLCIL